MFQPQINPHRFLRSKLLYNQNGGDVRRAGFDIMRPQTMSDGPINEKSKLPDNHDQNRL